MQKTEPTMSKKNPTTFVIESLVADLKNPSEAHRWSTRFGLFWLFTVVILSLVVNLVGAFYPDRLSLPPHPWPPRFLGLAALWMVSLCSALRVLYLQTLPQFNKTPGILLFLLSTLCLVGILIPEDPIRFSAFTDEMNTDVMGCGIFISVAGALVGLFIASQSLRIGACNRPVQAVAWSFATAGLASAILMHLYCHHHTFAHILIWHAFPILTVTLLGSLFLPNFFTSNPVL